MVIAHNTSSTKRTDDVCIKNNVTFDLMLLSNTTYNGLKNAGFYKPSPIQLHGIPLGKCGFDLLLEAKSGTGKTAVFTVVALEKLNLDKGLQTIILAPTREIAAQICDVIKEIGAGLDGLSVEVVMGGLPIQDDIAKFGKGKTVHILVGSPGRLRHLIHDKHIDTSSVRLLVLDEADKLMEGSFQADINYIFSLLPTEKQVILSSATYPDSCREFVSKYVNNAQHVCPDSTSVLMGISQMVTVVPFNTNILKQTKLRYEELLKILTKKQFKQCLIFCNYQARVIELHRFLTRDKWPSEQLYGLQQQTDRLDALRTLQEYKCRILISTDLAARGIDASNVDLVINFEPPYEWQTYLHRIGRAGRYGSYGTAVSILAKGKEEGKFKEMLGGMKDSLNIVELWNKRKYLIGNDVELTNGNGNQQQESNKTENNGAVINNVENKGKIYSEIWKEISNNTSKASDEIENFSDLLKSYEKPEVESFDNLLNMFENENVEELNLKQQSEYTCMKFNYEDTQISSIKSVINNKMDCSEKTMQKDIMPINFNTEPLVNSHKKVIKNDSKVIAMNKKSTKDVVEVEPCDNEEAEMLRLGLPTSFWSKQDRKKSEKKDRDVWPKKYDKHAINTLNTRVTNKTKVKLNTDANSYAYYDRGNHEILDPKLEGVRKKLESPETSTRILANQAPRLEHRSKDSPNIRICPIHGKKVVKSSQALNPSNHKTSNKIKKDTKEKSSKGNHDESYHIMQDYNQWYRNLKLRTQQIEMFLYLKELSNM